MKKMMTILLLVLGGILIFELFIFYLIVPGDFAWNTFQGENFRCRVPESQHHFREERGWHKNQFSGGAGEVYVSFRPYEGNPEEALDHFQRFLKPAYSARVEIFDGGRFLLERHGKGRRYVYLFTAGEMVFWVENTVRGSSIRTYKDILDRVVESLEIDGRGVASAFANSVEEVNREIRWLAQSKGLLGGLMLAIPVLIVVVVAAPILMLVGRLPRFGGERPLRAAGNLFAWVRHPLGIQGTLVAIALFEERFEVYSWRRRLIVVSREEGTVSAVLGKDKILVQRGNRRATIDLDHPHRWLGEIGGRGIGVRSEG